MESVGEWGDCSQVPAILAWEGAMTSEPTITPGGGAGHRAEGRGYGLVFIAAVLPLMIGGMK
jgi:hypothetical protein